MAWRLQLLDYGILLTPTSGTGVQVPVLQLDAGVVVEWTVVSKDRWVC